MERLSECSVQNLLDSSQPYTTNAETLGQMAGGRKKRDRESFQVRAAKLSGNELSLLGKISLAKFLAFVATGRIG